MSWQRDYQWERAAHKEMRARGWPTEVPLPQAFKRGQLAAIVGREPVDGKGDDLRWHISLQHRLRIPNWEELVSAGHELRPGVVFVIGVPPRSWWINVHPRVLHLWELRDEALAAQWRFERQGHRPT